jgi:hypothetical protein
MRRMLWLLTFQILACSDSEAGTVDAGRQDSGGLGSGMTDYCKQPVKDAGEDACLACLAPACCNVGVAFNCLPREGSTDDCYEDWIGCARTCSDGLKEGAPYQAFVDCMNTECLPNAKDWTESDGLFPHTSGAGLPLLQCLIGQNESEDDGGTSLGASLGEDCRDVCLPNWQF